ncbi:hypothetical protein DFH08DRAFT_809982 [Mycena albidolilacea]|uniref:CCHC-type domain-containing protein n=1 Tax=Mycena albidolilacea TaxID=1033008 RepID=A0AAD6ZYP7_9AGAR|nr:hypothetical protein DFH08DRAFT_809982 [Mycena albidolilacea]
MVAINSSNIPSSSSETASPITADSHELVALILEEYQCWKEKAGESTGSSALFGKSQSTHQHSNLSKDDGCFNYGGPGHMAKDCWAKSGSKAGRIYGHFDEPHFNPHLSRDTWLADSGC